jgi:hypothetical protein
MTPDTGTMIDMTKGDNRKVLAVIVAIGRLRIEARGLTFKGSTLRAMQAWGFTARRKATMLAELEAWYEDRTGYAYGSHLGKS